MHYTDACKYDGMYKHEYFLTITVRIHIKADVIRIMICMQLVDVICYVIVVRCQKKLKKL